MTIKVKVPSPGESITEVEVSSWFVKNGDYVSKNQLIAEIDSDKVTLEIHAEENGVITLMAKKGERIKVGDILCIIDKESSDENSKKSLETNVKKKEKILYKKFPSPASKKILKEKNISIESIQGTGKHGRITKKDCITKERFNSRSTRVTPLSSLRRKLSERLVSVKNQTAMLTTFNEVDMQEIIFIRKKYKNIFQEKHGVNLGFMSFFTLSCVRSLNLYPDVNAMIINEKEKINFEYCDISIAISGPKGLMVPVIRNAENLSFLGIEKEISRLSTSVRNGTISINEMKGGTFTITNGGVFGSMLSTPIINPPQSAILGMHKIVERPVVINGGIKIRPIMYLALSYDHRIIDGKESVGFLVSVKESIENPIDFLMEGSEKNIPRILEL
ncbi:MAG: 2-oxoglutarate dehydrogenase complex dihydrolipoyllysine-residue succinyltransferase [Flavobacteriales bacterium]|jgi:2-oxoglutarate dehydrogenase E2 component (dihydrolipoamide succinyltransferase)|uniref:2-oxoglutarate dehydrogenase complex dihydrolipoyllysine-residue succinyltransferase n=1 Tax=Blattabacterium sp. (Mastotermes darwiniensis) TaxID=39768 RepID=UPI000231DF57|nr:2-oxoglutarate dehydrogenase complex dihydrolipoyllysine-residue succinyltransferase [Blattabacterium sp. (Mastotermes darwiniensis)]AER40367.1 2-oxoglutarate dehydrogenase, E2 component [Blattabacterium sp. (Mastotermes darwiniensis) str. MADAR]MDR1804912.1 2-oxoglutarate dehydrogenase complex dihydrolipoyllysine-residue succinyltransferase [Flavobacteriales bacterium]